MMVAGAREIVETLEAILIEKSVFFLQLHV